MITEIDICIPCIWKIMFGIDCIGCGLTSSFIYILQLNFLDAYLINPLIFILIPFGIIYLKLDYDNFLKKSKLEKNN